MIPSTTPSGRLMVSWSVERQSARRHWAAGPNMRFEGSCSRLKSIRGHMLVIALDKHLLPRSIQAHFPLLNPMQFEDLEVGSNLSQAPASCLSSARAVEARLQSASAQNRFANIP